MNQTPSKLGFIAELDGLRGAAILSVMIFHAYAKTPFMRGAFIGVEIFFVLSGFLITTLLIQEFDQSGSISLRNFYLRRALRLLPALSILLIVICFASLFFLSTDDAYNNYIDSIISLAYLSNWARAFSIHPPVLLGHTWSLSVEEQFYILWPIILLTLLRTSLTKTHVTIIAIAIALLSWLERSYLFMNGSSIMRLFNGLDTRADALMIGCALASVRCSGLVTEKAKLMTQKLLRLMAPLSMLCLLIFSVFGDWRDSWMYYFGFFLIECLAAVLIVDVLLNPQSVIKKLLSMKWLVWVGSISYGLYLWHYPIYSLMLTIGLNRLTIITVGSMITFIVATFSYYLIERPALRLKEHFAQAAQQRNPRH